MSATLLLVEDNQHIMKINREALTMRGYRVLEAETIKQGRFLLDKEKPDLIVLDIMLPDGDGRGFAKEVRRGSGVPILFLSALGDENDILEGFNSGGDDYLPKAYGIGTLVARVEAILKRTMSVPEKITKGSLTIIVPSNEILINGEKAEKQRLSQNEFALLLYFAQNENRIMSGAFLYEAVWGQAMGASSSATRNTVYKLRKVLEGSGYTISHEPGHSDEKLHLAVEDIGQGMTPEDLQKLFSEYSRFNMEANHTTEGTGLGLTITKNIVELMNGEIKVESEYGKGSTFRVTIQQKTVDSPIIGAALAKQLCSFTFSQKREKLQFTREPMPYGRILIVDDVETNLYVATGLLMPYKLKVETVNSGLGAIKKITDGKTVLTVLSQSPLM